MANCVGVTTAADPTLGPFTEMRQRRPDTSRMANFAFDLLFEHDVDLRSLSLSERQRDLARLRTKSCKAVPWLRLVESFAEGPPLLEWCAHYQLEGIVSKRLSAAYMCGLSRSGVKIKRDGWRGANQFRHKMLRRSRSPPR
jgi:ATP-dependent DNA ligase